MANFLNPKADRYSETRERGSWTVSMTPETQLPLIDHVDIGQIAVAAFQRPHQFAGRAIGLASELLTIQQTLDQLANAAGKPGAFQPIFMSDEEVQAQKASNVLVHSSRTMRSLSNYVDMHYLTATVPLTSFKDFLQREQQSVSQTYG